jgi:hypothetical protein
MNEDDRQRFFDTHETEARRKITLLLVAVFNDLARRRAQEAAQNGIGPGSKDRA